MSFCNRCPIALSASMFDLLQSFLNIVTKEQLLECVTLCHSPPQIFHITSSLGLTSKVFTRPCRMCNTSQRRFPRSESTRLPLHVLRCHGALQSAEGSTRPPPAGPRRGPSPLYSRGLPFHLLKSVSKNLSPSCPLPFSLDPS